MLRTEKETGLESTQFGMLLLPDLAGGRSGRLGASVCSFANTE